MNDQHNFKKAAAEYKERFLNWKEPVRRERTAEEQAYEDRKTKMIEDRERWYLMWKGEL